MSGLTDEERELKRLAEGATPGPWMWWTSCSFRRLSSMPSGKDGDVLRAVVHNDGVADIHGSEADRRFIQEADPATVLRLLARIEILDAACRDAHRALFLGGGSASSVAKAEEILEATQRE